VLGVAKRAASKFVREWGGVKEMHAVIISGGKQYRVEEGQYIKVEKLAADAGNSIDFDKVLMLSDGENAQIGAPYLSGCTVQAQVVGHGRGDKITIIKVKRRKHHRKTQGHRQAYTELKITSIRSAKAA
jgi:large subunit ribosomal protein L21